MDEDFRRAKTQEKALVFKIAPLTQRFCDKRYLPAKTPTALVCSCAFSPNRVRHFQHELSGKISPNIAVKFLFNTQFYPSFKELNWH